MEEELGVPEQIPRLKQTSNFEIKGELLSTATGTSLPVAKESGERRREKKWWG